jgi:hypothetical protein
MDQGLAPSSRRFSLLRSLAPPSGGRVVARIRDLNSRWWLVPILLFAWGIYLYFVSAGGMKNWPVYGDYLDRQADAFRSGHLYLALAPAPQLLKAVDPYDSVNSRYWALDLSYYHGRYYTYWGPVPALIQAAAKAILGIEKSIGDQYIGLFSACLATWAGALIIERMARRLFGTPSRALVALSILAFAFANPMLHNVSTAGTYQSAILAAQGWLMPGILAAFDAVWYAGTPRARRWRFLAAGVCWALAAACRVTVLPSVAVLIGVTALAEGWTDPHRWLRSISNALWLGLPVALSGIALLIYNKLRFDHYFEFGLSLQLSGYPRIRFETKYWLPNLYSYIYRHFVVSCRFPYIYQEWWSRNDTFPEGFPVPSDYNTDEPVIGWLRAVPLTWLGGFAFLLGPRPRGFRFRQARVYLWCLISFTAVASLSGLTAIGVYAATMRYLSDVTPGLVLLALLGAFALRSHRFALLAPKLASTLIGSLCVATASLGLLIGYQGYGGQFYYHHPELDAKFDKALSVCGDSQPQLPHFLPYR